MEVVEVACNKCGAPLEVGEDTKFVTCGFCKARLRIRHKGGAHFTEVRKRVRAVEKKTAAVEKKAAAVEKKAASLDFEVKELRLKQELDELEDRWREEREELYIRQKNGGTVRPEAWHAQLAFAIAGCALVAGLMMLDAGPGIAPALLLMAAFAAVGGVLSKSRFTKFNAALGRYQAERDDVEYRLAKLRRKQRRR